MFDIDSGKLLIIGVVALVVIGPKELPGVLRQVGQAVGKLRRMAGEFQGQFMDAMRESELEELRKNVEKVADPVSSIDPLGDVRGQLDTVRNDVETALSAPVESVSASDLPPATEAPSIAASETPAPEPAPEPAQEPAKAGGHA
jgi:sec-independent protein translocase protein TatB